MTSEKSPLSSGWRLCVKCRTKNRLGRQGVASIIDGDIHFGQVTATSEIGVQVYSSYGLRWMPRTDVIRVVSPLYTMMMFDLAVPTSTWSEAFRRLLESVGSR